MTQVIKQDGSGHHADSETIDELTGFGIVEANSDRVSFTERGDWILDRLSEVLRKTGTADQTDAPV